MKNQIIYIYLIIYIIDCNYIYIYRLTIYLIAIFCVMKLNLSQFRISHWMRNQILLQDLPVQYFFCPKYFFAIFSFYLKCKQILVHHISVLMMLEKNADNRIVCFSSQKMSYVESGFCDQMRKFVIFNLSFKTNIQTYINTLFLVFLLFLSTS